MYKLKKRIASIITAAAVAFGSAGVLPDIGGLTNPLIITSYAEETSTPTVVTTWSELKTAMAAGGNIKLGADVTDPDKSSSSYLSVPENTTVTLDLNGHTIDRGLANASAIENGYVITVRGNLTVKDSSTAGTGIITGGNTTGNGGGVYVASGSFTLAGGTITGCKASGDSNVHAYGGGVFVDKNAAFTMTGGTISRNTAKYNGGYGGGVCVSGGTFTMSDGSISNNKTADNGGGVYVDQSGTFTMTGGTISGSDNAENRNT